MSRSGSQVSRTIAGRRLDAGNHDRCWREVVALVRMRPASTRRWWRARSGQAMQMAAGPGPGFPDTRADGSGPFDAIALAGRAWLAALPDEPAAQRRVMAGLADRYEAWPLATSLLVGCSLGRSRPTRFPASTPRSALTPRAARPAPRGREPWKRWWRRAAGTGRACRRATAPERDPPASGSGGSSPSSPTAPSSTWRSSPRRRSKRAAAAAPGRHPAVPGTRPAGLPETGRPDVGRRQRPRGEPQATYAVTGEQVTE
jgi:hypothetical protein